MEARDALKAAHEALPIELSINSFLIETGTQADPHRYCRRRAGYQAPEQPARVMHVDT